MTDSVDFAASGKGPANSRGEAASPNHFAGRRFMLRALCEELVGPSPNGPEVDLEAIAKGRFPSDFKADGPYVQMGSNEEILCVEPPGLRYGVGILYPWGTMQKAEGADDSAADPDVETTQNVLAPKESKPAREPLTRKGEASLKRLTDPARSRSEWEKGDEFNLSGANKRRPTSMAVSFLVRLPAGTHMVVRARGGRYEPIKIAREGGWPRTWWVRRKVRLEARFEASQVQELGEGALQAASVDAEGTGSLDIRVEAYVRRSVRDDERLITVCLINRTTDGLGNNGRSLFQASFDVAFEREDARECILPYPRAELASPDEEEQTLDLLYRDFETYAIGHGCASDWSIDEGGIAARRVFGIALPSFETSSITPDIRRADGAKLEVAMAPLAGLLPEDDGREALEELVELYGRWIDEKASEAMTLDGRYKVAAQRHIELCRRCLERMRDGVALLDGDPIAARAFRLANEAILSQQLRGARRARSVTIADGNVVFDNQAAEIDLVAGATGRGTWRPFQIAFLLMSLRSSIEGDDADRETTDLIWFPTGGGKTEAYFGLAAFSAFHRRLVDSGDAGVHILMRYTLRLLTAQQFQRASGLICAMERIRARERDSLGDEPFSIGIWLGGETTPNTRKDARYVFRQLLKGDRFVANKLLLTKCPWCSAQIGPLDFKKKPPKGAIRVLGYYDNGKTVGLRCSDPLCKFVDGLPIYVIDDDIYERRPTMVIGTVDKFAMLAWRPQARALFGVGRTGERECSPPGLIIQDELHLISGPLGSMTGLYEAVIEDLCTDHRGQTPVKPKIVCSTATIRRFREQANALFARDRTELFPPPGLSAADSFFATYARGEDGALAPGRIFVGVYAPALGSIQTAEVRTFTALLQTPKMMPAEQRDPWWTVLGFFNSLREIGTAATLFQSDIPDRLKILRRRFGLDFKDIRRLYEVMELTSRLKSDEVPKAIDALEIVAGDEPKRGIYPVDACLASNIIEVGVDIDRLSLLAIVGQPKSTSQYIQVAGRVGRRWYERPGLVVTVLGPNNPRDRSHYERFRSYHERLYAQVEPTSVTPYSPPVLDRALHAVMAAYIRQYGNPNMAASPLPVPEEELERLREMLEARVAAIDPNEASAFGAKFSQRLREWKAWMRTEWDSRRAGGDVGLLTAAGSYLPSEDWRFTWATPMSMRNVDAECRAEITRGYLEQGEGESDVQ